MVYGFGKEPQELGPPAGVLQGQHGPARPQPAYRRQQQHRHQPILDEGRGQADHQRGQPAQPERLGQGLVDLKHREARLDGVKQPRLGASLTEDR